MIEDLQFFKDRIELAGPNGRMINRVRAEDRTVAVIKRWMTLSEELKAARSATMQTLEARPGKGDGVSLVIMDRPKFDSLQEEIRAHNEAVAGLETAIKALDSMGDVWHTDLSDRVGILGRVEHVERRQIARMSAGYLQKGSNTGLPAEEILARDPEFQRLKNICEAAIEDANAKLVELRPKLEQIECILKAVGC